MNATNLFPLVKVDVAAVYLGLAVRKIHDLADGGSRHEPGLLWVFNLANNPDQGRRELRFYKPELLARAKGAETEFRRMSLAEVINTILPERRERFHSGEIDRLFQIRHGTRIYYEDLPGVRCQPGYVYSRQVVVDFLTRRWLGTKIVTTIREAA